MSGASGFFGAAWLAAASPLAHAADVATTSMRVGSMTLHRCAAPDAWCGNFSRPLDPAGVVAGEVPIYFEFYPHTGVGASQGTLVATEGGPGYPATLTRDAYLALYARCVRRATC